jgi:hypothetical protein
MAGLRLCQLSARLIQTDALTRTCSKEKGPPETSPAGLLSIFDTHTWGNACELPIRAQWLLQP